MRKEKMYQIRQIALIGIILISIVAGWTLYWLFFDVDTVTGAEFRKAQAQISDLQQQIKELQKQKNEVKTEVNIESDTYDVKKGNTLWKVAENKCGKGDAWPGIAAANDIKPPRYTIHPKDKLKIDCAIPQGFKFQTVSVRRKAVKPVTAVAEKLNEHPVIIEKPSPVELPPANLEPVTNPTENISVVAPVPALETAPPMPVPQKPTIVFFKAQPETISAGQPTMLAWETKGATKVEIKGIGVQAPNSQITVNPRTTTEYTVVASGPGGESSVTLSVSVAKTKENQKRRGLFSF